MIQARLSLERLRSYVERHRALLDPPGLALALTDRERVLGVMVDGFASVEAHRPVAPSHRFQIGSHRKGLSAVAAPPPPAPDERPRQCTESRSRG